MILLEIFCCWDNAFLLYLPYTIVDDMSTSKFNVCCHVYMNVMCSTFWNVVHDLQSYIRIIHRSIIGPPITSSIDNSSAVNSSDSQYALVNSSDSWLVPCQFVWQLTCPETNWSNSQLACRCMAISSGAGNKLRVGNTKSGALYSKIYIGAPSFESTLHNKTIKNLMQ